MINELRDNLTDCDEDINLIVTSLRKSPVVCFDFAHDNLNLYGVGISLCGMQLTKGFNGLHPRAISDFPYYATCFIVSIQRRASFVFGFNDQRISEKYIAEKLSLNEIESAAFSRLINGVKMQLMNSEDREEEDT